MPRRLPHILAGALALALLAPPSPAANAVTYEPSPKLWSGTFTLNMVTTPIVEGYGTTTRLNYTGTIEATGPGRGTMTGAFSDYGTEEGGCASTLIGQNPTPISVTFTELNVIGGARASAPGLPQDLYVIIDADNPNITVTELTCTGDVQTSAVNLGEAFDTGCGLVDAHAVYLGLIQADGDVFRATQPQAWDCTHAQKTVSWTSTSDMTGTLGGGEGFVSFTWDSSTAVGSRTVTFDPAKSVLPPGAALLWDFGDGTTARRTTTTPFEHEYSTIGEYGVTAGLVCAGCPAVADSDRLVVDPVATYSPQLRLHPGEKNFPARPSWFVKHSNLKWNLSDCTDLSVDETPDPARLGGNDGAKPYTARQHYRGCVIRTGKTYNSTQMTRPFTTQGRPAGLSGGAGFYLTLDDKKKYRKGEGTDIEMTYSIKDGTYITYWFFYAYDPKVKLGSKLMSHEGDWERLTVLIDSRNRAEEVGYFQHTCDAELYPWDQMHQNGYLTSGTHPIAYSAKGAHASYPYVGSFDGGVCEEKSGLKAGLEAAGTPPPTEANGGPRGASGSSTPGPNPGTSSAEPGERSRGRTSPATCSETVPPGHSAHLTRTRVP